jgi:hypothetical protein
MINTTLAPADHLSLAALATARLYEIPPTQLHSQIKALQTTAQTTPFKKWFGNSQALTDHGTPLLLFHGTNRNFTRFDKNRCRSILNRNYQGDGFHFTPCPEVAAKYACANRNQTLDPLPTYDAVAREFPPIVQRLFHRVVEQGYDAGWQNLSDHEMQSLIAYQHRSGKNINDILDIALYVEGTKYERNPDTFISIWGARESLPDWLIDSMNEMGMTDAVPNPRIIPAYLKASNVLQTSNPWHARTAQVKGYDAVKYTGEHAIDDEPEYIVFSTDQILTASDVSTSLLLN